MKAMSPQETTEFVRHNRFGVLSLARDGQAYGLPLYYGFDGRDLYFQTRAGLKDRYATETTEACFTIVRVVNLDDWASVQVFGRLERLGADIPSHALLSVPLPPGWGESADGEPARPASGVVVHRLAPQRVSGRYSENAPMSAEEREIAFGGM